MRIALIAVFLACMISSTNSPAPVIAAEDGFVDDGFFEKLDQMIPVLSAKFSHDRFSVDVAEWHADERQLVVRASTTHKKGTLLTMMGLPASTMVDAFQISSDHSVRFFVPLDDEQAVPCQVIVKSAFAAETVDVRNAPSACQSLIQVSGTVAVSPTMAMANGWVTVAVDDVIFATIANENGAYELEVYSDSIEAFVTITAMGKVDNQESVVHIYAGSFASLLDTRDLSAAVSVSAWGVEIFGRKRFRLMMASN